MALDVTCIVIGAFMLLPLVILITESFSPGAIPTFPPSGFSLQWYLQIPSRFYGASATSLLIAAGTACASVVLGVAAALATTRTRLLRPVDTFLRAPLLMPSLVIGVSLFLFYVALRNWVEFDLRDSPFGILLGHILIGAPYAYVASVARLATFDRQLEEAAFGMGASPFATLRLITLPVIRPTIFAGALFAFVASSHDVTVALFIVTSKTTTLPVELLRATMLEILPWILAVGSIEIIFYALLALLFERLIGLRGTAAATAR